MWYSTSAAPAPPQAPSNHDAWKQKPMTAEAQTILPPLINLPVITEKYFMKMSLMIQVGKIYYYQYRYHHHYEYYYHHSSSKLFLMFLRINSR